MSFACVPLSDCQALQLRSPRQVFFRLEAQLGGTKSSRFFWSDWVSDPGLRSCSLAAKGLWMECLCICAQGGGYLQINGRGLSYKDLSRLINNSSDNQIEILMTELEVNGVFTRAQNGKIYSRRMVRTEKFKKNGRAGGNPNLLKTKKTPDLVNLPPEDNLIPVPIESIKKEGKPSFSISSNARAREAHYPLPDNWEPNSDHFLLADQLGYFPDRVVTEAAAMRDWAKAEAKTKANWDAFFSKWLRDPRAKPNRETKGDVHGKRAGSLRDAWDKLAQNYDHQTGSIVDFGISQRRLR